MGGRCGQALPSPGECGQAQALPAASTSAQAHLHLTARLAPVPSAGGGPSADSSGWHHGLHLAQGSGGQGQLRGGSKEGLGPSGKAGLSFAKDWRCVTPWPQPGPWTQGLCHGAQGSRRSLGEPRSHRISALVRRDRELSLHEAGLGEKVASVSRKEVPTRSQAAALWSRTPSPQTRGVPSSWDAVVVPALGDSRPGRQKRRNMHVLTSRWELGGGSQEWRAEQWQWHLGTCWERAVSGYRCATRGEEWLLGPRAGRQLWLRLS